MKIERIDDRNYTVHYQTFADLKEDKPKTEDNASLDRSNMDLVSRNWYGPGCSTAREFTAHVDKGWEHLVNSVKSKANELVFKPDVMPAAVTTAMRRKRVRAEAGNELDIHRVYQGRMDTAWSATKHELQNMRRRAVHIYINIGGMAMVDVNDSQWRAAAAYRICDIFQRNNYSVEITVGASATGVFRKTSRMMHTSFTAKPSNMPLNLNLLAVQATLGWHRVFNFHARCCNNAGYEVSGSMGATVQMPTPYLKTIPGLILTVPANTLTRDMAMGVVRLAQKTLEKEAAK